MDLLDYTDYDSVRQLVFDKVKDAVGSSFPINNTKYTMQLEDLNYAGPDKFSLADQKKAILQNSTLARRLTGRWSVTDNETGKIINTTAPRTILNVPYLTNRGTFIRNGTDYTITRQLRLLPGVYTRRTADDMIESQFNVKPRTGLSFRIFMDPSTSVFYMRHRGNKIPLYPILTSMGYDPEGLKQSWGLEIFEKNKVMERKPHAINWLNKFQDAEALQKAAKIDLAHVCQLLKEAEGVQQNLLTHFNKMELDSDNVQSTLGQPFDRVTPEALVAASRKILRVNRGEEDTDDRDSLRFQTIHDVSDFLADKIKQDQNNIAKKVLWKVTRYKGAGDRIPPSFMDAHVSHLFNITGLALPLEEISPFDSYDQNQRVIRLGEGAIQGVESIPMEARAVQPSYLNYIDGIRAPESLKVGVDMKLASGVRKGPDNLLYTQFIDAKTGKKTWVNSRQAANSVIGFPSMLTSKDKYVPAMRQAKGTAYIPRDEVQYIIPEADSMFSEGANLIPLKSGSKAMRLLMASKYSSQAVPLTQREAPLVQTKHSSGVSVEQKLGAAMGAIRSEKSGVVQAVRSTGIIVANDDGTVNKYDTYTTFPLARKTLLHNVPLVKAGDKVREGGVLAGSNYTDDQGITALGTNLRVGYLNWHGKTYEDAVVVSESAAKKLTSQHLFSEKFETEEDVSLDRSRFSVLFPGRYSREQLDTIDEGGVVKEGTVLKYGDPIFLAVHQRMPSKETLGRRLNTDESVTWQHHFPAEVLSIVTDTSETKKGPKIYIKAELPLETGDKLSNRSAAKGVTAEIVPDDQMPKTEDGRPLDILLSPLSILSRTNSNQLIEAALGKVAKKTGKTYVLPGFLDEDMVDFAKKELKNAGLSDTEKVFDPKLNKMIPKVFVGNAYFYKLQHMAESKVKARSTAGYCYDKETEVLTHVGWKYWAEVCADDKLATLKNDQLVYEKPLELIQEFYEGEMLGYAGRYIDFLVTPNHQMYVQFEDWKKAIPKRRRHRDYDFLSAERIYGRNKYTVKQFVNEPVEGHLQKTITIPKVRYSRRKEDICMRMEDYAELAGWYISEGHAGKYAIFISQDQAAHPKDFADIGNLLDRIGLKYCILKLKSTRKGRAYKVYGKELALHFRKMGDSSYTKQIPRILLDANSKVQKCLLKTLLLGDGTIPVSEKATPRYFTTSKQLADSVQELCIKLGIGAIIHKESPREKSIWNVHASYCIGLHFKRTEAWINPAHPNSTAHYYKTAYTDQIYCATMSTGLLYVRRNGKPMWCGNSHEETPARGGKTGSKHFGTMELEALLGIGAKEVIKDLKIVKGQKNDDFWRQVKLGQTPMLPRAPLVYDKFKKLIQAAGITLREEKDADHIFAMSNDKVTELTGDREITNAATYTAINMKPIPGGLFDPDATGSSHKGEKWSYIKLPEPLLNPIMETPIKSILGINQKELDAILSGKVDSEGKTGATALKSLLERVDLQVLKEVALEDIKKGVKSKRDAAVKRYNYITAIQKQGLKPEDFIWDRVPVLPPKYRPIFREKKLTIVADPNYMYKALLEGIEDFKDAKAMEIPGETLVNARSSMQQNLRALIGVTDPVQPELKQKRVGGILQAVIGKGSPKASYVQRRVIGTNIDMAGLAVATPNPSLKLNQVGLPEDKAWDLYEPFIVRRLIQKGMPATAAAKSVSSRSETAHDALQEVVKSRPVLINRAPTLHKYSIMAVWPVLTKGHTLQVNPSIVKPFNLDFDGDIMSFSVPVTSAAVKEAIAKMLPERLLLSERQNKPHFVPGNEYAQGLYLATKSPSRKPVRRFNTKKEALTAYQKGRISVDDPITIG